MIKQKFNPTHQRPVFKRMLAFRGRALFSRLQTICRGGNNPSFLSCCNLPGRRSLLGNGLNVRFWGTVPDVSESKNETLKKQVLEKRYISAEFRFFLERSRENREQNQNITQLLRMSEANKTKAIKSGQHSRIYS